MARASREAKAESRERILREAARLFRKCGIAHTRVSEVMEAAGLTHGGFYRHFSSKEELVGAAMQSATADLVSELENEIDTHGPRRSLSKFVERYLSETHVNNPGTGCPVAALSTEAARGPPACRQPIAQAVERFCNVIAHCLGEMAGTEPETASARARAVFTTLVGAVVVARTMASKAERKTILRAAEKAVASLIGRADEPGE